MITLSDFAQPDPARSHVVTVGPNPCRNWPLTISTALDCLKRYGHALITSNGSEDRPATEWRVEREVS